MNKKYYGFAAVALALFLNTDCSNTDHKITQNAAAAAQSAAVGAQHGPDGMAIFRQYCILCHGADGKLGLNGAKDLSKSALTLEERIAMVEKGKGLMTPFGEMLSPEEIKAVAEYTLALKVQQ